MNRRESDIEKGLSTAPPAEALADAAPTAGSPGPPASGAKRDPVPAHLRQLSGRLAGLTLPRQVFVLAIWPFLEQVLNFLVGYVDTALAGHMPGKAVAATNAIGVGAYIIWGMNIMQMSVGVGATAVIARAVGGKHRRVANAALGQAVILSLVLGPISGGLVYGFAPDIAGFMELRGESFAMCVQYLRIVGISAIFSSVFFVGSACLRASGDTRSPFIVLAGVNIINTVVSWALVFGPQPIGGHGVAGIAWGTVAAWVVGAVLILIMLARDGGQIRLRWIRLRPHWHTMKRIVRISSASLFESMGMWVGNFLVMKIVGIVSIIEHAAQGAHIIAVRLEAISYLPCMALGIAASTLTGQYLGLGDPERAKRAALLCWKYGMLVMGVMGLMFLLIPTQLVRLVTNEPVLLATAPTLLMICGPVQIFFATAIVLSNAMRGAGDTASTMRLTYISIYIIRVPAVYLFAVVMDLGLNGVWLGLCGELLIRGLLFGGRFFQGKWQSVKV